MTNEHRDRTASQSRSRRRVALACVAVIVPLAALAAPGLLGGCDTVAHSPAVSFDVTVDDGDLVLTHAGGEELDRAWATRTTARIESDGERTTVPFPTGAEHYPLRAGDTVRIGSAAMDRDPGEGDRVTVRYEKRVDYPWYCVGRSAFVTYTDGRLAANGTLVPA
jgi:hypothetical protein